jgi:myo-inositol-1(or 4)-monophosphatase
MTPTEREQLTRVALEVAEEAARLVHGAYRGAFRTSLKGRADLVTEYDVKSEQLIRARLAERTPALRVVGEEQGGEADGPTWFCDPIDGTTNFVHGHPFFCVSIGLLDRGAPLLGAVVAPALDLRYAGSVGGAALRNGAPCRVSDTRSVGDALLATGFYPGDTGAISLRDNIASFERVLQKARGVRRCGSAALELCMTADGTYDAYWERTLNAWDVAGGAAIVLAAGGRISDLAGGPPDLAAGNIIASNGHVHDELRALL